MRVISGDLSGTIAVFYTRRAIVPTPEETAEQVEQRLEQETRKAERLAAKLRELNIDPDKI